VNLELAAVTLDEFRERSLVSGSRRVDDLLLRRVLRGRLLSHVEPPLDPTAATPM
jgi:hypothetical protein